MYGKYFASTFTGSMFGAGAPVFAVWGYVIANTINSRVELNPNLLAAVLGTPVEQIHAAIQFLTRPDPASRNIDELGCRLVQDGQFQYRVVSHEIYRAIRNEDDRRAYNRQKQRESRARRSSPVTLPVNDSQSLSALSAQAEAEAEAEAEEKRETRAEPARRPTPPNPHAKPTNLIAGASQRRHGQHAWCNQRGLCVTPWVHEELVGKRGGSHFEGELRLWYEAEITSLNGEPIGDEPDTFWRNRFAATWPPVTTRPAPKKASMDDQAKELSDYLTAKGLK